MGIVTPQTHKKKLSTIFLFLSADGIGISGTPSWKTPAPSYEYPTSTSIIFCLHKTNVPKGPPDDRQRQGHAVRGLGRGGREGRRRVMPSSPVPQARIGGELAVQEPPGRPPTGVPPDHLLFRWVSTYLYGLTRTRTLLHPLADPGWNCIHVAESLLAAKKCRAKYLRLFPTEQRCGERSVGIVRSTVRTVFRAMGGNLLDHETNPFDSSRDPVRILLRLYPSLLPPPLAADEELELLRETSLHTVTVQWKSQVTTDFRELEHMVLPSEGSSTARDILGDCFTKEKYMWALGTVRVSRGCNIHDPYKRGEY